MIYGIDHNVWRIDVKIVILLIVVFIEFVVSGSNVQVATYSGTGNKVTSSGAVGRVKTPDGAVVTKTSAYGRVKFDIKSILSGSYITKMREIYCAIELD